MAGDTHVHIYMDGFAPRHEAQATAEPEELRDRLDSLMHHITNDGYIPSEEEYSLLKRAGYLKY